MGRRQPGPPPGNKKGDGCLTALPAVVLLMLYMALCKPMDRAAELAALVRERFGDPADVAREGTQPPPLTDAQRAANHQSLKSWR